jgi:hypothetical protein
MSVPSSRTLAFTRSTDRLSVVAAEVSKMNEAVDSFLEH